MKVLIALSMSLLTSISLLGQSSHPKQLFLPDTANRQWLTTLKAREMLSQWEMIASRYFESNETLSKDDQTNRVVPMLIVDGIAIDITDDTNTARRKELKNLLTKDKIASVQVIDKEPEGLYINKAFTGMILVRTNDKKIGKKLSRINTK